VKACESYDLRLQKGHVKHHHSFLQKTKETHIRIRDVCIISSFVPRTESQTPADPGVGLPVGNFLQSSISATNFSLPWQASLRTPRYCAGRFLTCKQHLTLHRVIAALLLLVVADIKDISTAGELLSTSFGLPGRQHTTTPTSPRSRCLASTRSCISS
jgi:hypothetical protein